MSTPLPRPALLRRSRALLACSLPALAWAQNTPPSSEPPAAAEPAPAAVVSPAEPAPPLSEQAPSTPVTAPDGPVRLAGSNGREVDFAGIWEARPDGLVVVTTADAPLTLVGWDKFDLARMKKEQPSIDAARQRALFLRSPQPINLGLFAGLLTPSQAGSELRRLLDESQTIKVPVRYRTTTKTTSSVTIAPRPVIYNGIILPPSDTNFVSQTNKTVSETRFSPDELTTSPRRVLETLGRTTGILAQDRRDLHDLVKANPVLIEEAAAGLDRIAASLPPRHLMPNDPTAVTLALRLREFSTGLRELTTAAGIDYSDQMLIRDLLYLADSPFLR
jgi:hypothetical protein